MTAHTDLVQLNGFDACGLTFPVACRMEQNFGFKNVFFWAYFVSAGLLRERLQSKFEIVIS